MKKGQGTPQRDVRHPLFSCTASVISPVGTGTGEGNDLRKRALDLWDRNRFSGWLTQSPGSGFYIAAVKPQKGPL